ncbi:MAG: InlB B-repeat-containing protein [Treponema sp.]|nr:InlB B-repeat-containing protein [Treponema sp.]
MKKINGTLIRLFAAGILLAALPVLFFIACLQAAAPESSRKRETVTISLDANGGGFEDGSSAKTIVKTIGTGLTLSELPAVQRGEDFTFAGWYTDQGGNAKYDFSKAAGTDFTLYARWNWSFTVTFDAKDGTISGNSRRTVNSPATTVNSLPSAVNGNNAFLGWFTDDGVWEEPFTVDTEVSGNITVYARWNNGPLYLAVTFDANGGAFPDTETEKEVQVASFGSGAAVPVQDWPSDPELTGKEFDGWYTLAEGGTLVVQTAVITESQTFYAHWADEVLRVDITLDAWKGEWSGGTKTKTFTSQKVTQLAALVSSEIPALKGFTFSGWYTKNSDEDENWGTQFTAQTEVTGNITLYAKWVWNDSLGITSISYAVNAADGLEGTLSNGSTYTGNFAPGLVSGTGTVETVNGLKVASGSRYDFGPQAGAFLSKTDWTLEFYVHSTSTSTGASPNPLLFSRVDNDKNYGGIWIENYNWYFLVRTNNSSQTRTQTAANNDANTWYHMAYVKSGNRITVYQNGQALALGSTEPNFSMLASNAYFKALFHNYFGASYLKFYKFALYSRAWETADFAAVMDTVNTLNGTP